MAKKPVDNSAHYKSTGKRLKDKTYNKVVKRYGEKGNKWTTSDTVIWYGSIYEMPAILGYLLQLFLFWWIAMFAINRYGDPIYGLIAIAVILLVRLSMMMTQVRVTREEIEKMSRNF